MISGLALLCEGSMDAALMPLGLVRVPTVLRKGTSFLKTKDPLLALPMLTVLLEITE